MVSIHRILIVLYMTIRVLCFVFRFKRGVGKRSGKAGCFAPADSGVLLLLRENYLCLVLSFLLPHFHLLPASLYSSALQVLWKQLKKVEATFASTAEIRRKVS